MRGVCDAQKVHECAIICTCLVGRKLHMNIRENGIYSSPEKFLQKIAYVFLAQPRSRPRRISNLPSDRGAEPRHRAGPCRGFVFTAAVAVRLSL